MKKKRSSDSGTALPDILLSAQAMENDRRQALSRTKAPLLEEDSSVSARELVAIAKLLRPHGVKGEIKSLVLTDFPERFSSPEKSSSPLWIKTEQGTVYRTRLLQSRPHTGCLLLTLEGIDGAGKAGMLRNSLLCVRRQDLSALEQDEYWHFDLIGLQVLDCTTGEALGTLTEIMEAPCHDIFVITSPSGKEILIPAAGNWVQEVDLTRSLMRVNVPRYESELDLENDGISNCEQE